jgi:hypothetical protein
MTELLQCFAATSSIWPLVAAGALAFGLLIGAAIARV